MTEEMEVCTICRKVIDGVKYVVGWCVRGGKETPVDYICETCKEKERDHVLEL